jgi:hypothetical protein
MGYLDKVAHPCDTRTASLYQRQKTDPVTNSSSKSCFAEEYQNQRKYPDSIHLFHLMAPENEILIKPDLTFS